MQYLLLIYSDETADANVSKEVLDAWMGEYYAYTEALTKAGVNKGGEALHPTSAATTVRVRAGKKVVSPRYITRIVDHTGIVGINRSPVRRSTHPLRDTQQEIPGAGRNTSSFVVRLA